MATEQEDAGTSRLMTIRVSSRTHKALRIRVAEEDTSIQRWVEALIEQELEAPRQAAGKKKREH